MAIVNGRLPEASEILEAQPESIRTGNPEEDRLLADITGRNDIDTVRYLLDHGADRTARALDGGTPLHQAAWFGQPENASILVSAGAPLDDFGDDHYSSPIGWAVHGSRYSGGADQRQENYIALVRLLLEAGSALTYPGQTDGKSYFDRMIEDASAEVREILLTSRG